MNKIKRCLLIIFLATVMLCCGLLVGCEKEVVLNLRTVYVVYPNNNYSVFGNSSPYVTRTFFYDIDDFRYYESKGSTSIAMDVLYEGNKYKFKSSYIYDDFVGYTYIGVYDRREGGSRICYTPDDATANEIKAMKAYDYYYARYEPIPFMIKFDSGMGSSVADKTVLYGDTMTSLSVPNLQSTEYIFDGWYSDSGLTDRVTDEKGNILLTKQQFNAENYQLGCILPYISLYRDTETCYIKSEEDLDHYGKYTEEARAPYKGFSSTLYAKFVEKTYTVGFDYGYGREEMNTEETVVGGSVLEDLPSPEIDGYKVAGWSYDVGGYNLYDGEAITSDTVLHAIWRRYKYIDLWSNGEKVKNLLMYYGSAYYPSMSEEFELERDGYRLVGWYTSPYFEPDTQVMIANFEDSYTALYAKWEPVN